MAKKAQENRDVREQPPQGGWRFLRYSLVLVLLGVVVLAWLSLLTFSRTDPPSAEVAAPNREVSNAAGYVGAWIAFQLRYWLGAGVYMGLMFMTVAAFLLMMGGRISDLPWRLIGIALLITATSSAVYLFNPVLCDDLHSGTAGVLGISTGRLLTTRFALPGAWLIVVITLLIGLMLAADNLVLQLPRFGKKVWQQRSQLGNVVQALRSALPSGQAAQVAMNAGGSTAVAELDKAAAGSTAAADADADDDEDEPAEDEDDPIVEYEIPHTAMIPPTGRGTGLSGPLPVSAKAAVPPPVSAGAEPAGEADAEDAESQSAPAPQPRPKPAAIQVAEAEAAARAAHLEAARAAQAANNEALAPLAQAAMAAPPPPPPRPAPKLSEKPPAPIIAGGGNTFDGHESPFALPPRDLLAEPTGGYIESQSAQAQQNGIVLQQTLNDFNVAAQVVGHMTGPVITMFELSLAPGVKVSQVANLANDIARALAVPGVRIVSPIPGKDTIGVEVPNMEKEMVRIKELMLLTPETERKLQLPLYLGKDAGGGPIVADLGSMPHMLIAGTTGSGKSVCINSIIISLVLTRTPQQVRLILCDPKMVEMAAFENIPHLLCPVVNDMRKAEEILEWAATKMDERYELLKEAGVKNIVGFNRLSPDEIYQRFNVDSDEEKARVPTSMPYYVIIIDELADLMMTSSKEVESHIIRIAQKARAVGIHLVLATQRPSVNVVTGLIKSNMPCRISFRVASRQESRIVLDQNGADVLLGQGDMLFLKPGTSSLIRAQGTYIEDAELRSIVQSLRTGGEPQYNPELIRLQTGAGIDGGGEKDELFDQAVEIVLATNRGSVSLLQRRLQVGYSRASRIIDQMAEAGLLGDYKGSQARECLITLEDWQAMKASIQADQSGQSSADGEPTSA